MGGMIKCKMCGKIMHSTWVHDFKRCKCINAAFIDGGDEYTRWGAMCMDMVEFIEHTHEEKDNEKDN